GPIFSVTGGVILGMLVLGPGLAQDAAADPARAAQVALAAWAMASLLTQVVAVLTQWFAFAGRPDGGVPMIVLLGLIDVAPLAAGSYYHLNWLRQMSISAHVAA